MEIREDTDRVAQLEKENQRLRSAVEELSILNDIATALSSTRSLDKIIELMVQKCVKHLKVEQGAVMLLDEKDQSSPFRTMVRQADTLASGLPYRLDSQLTGWMLKHQKPLHIKDFQKDERFQKTGKEEFPIRSLLCVPLRLKGRMTGLLIVFNKRTPEGFTAEDQRLLTIIAAQSAQIIENARLYEEEQAFIRMQEEMRLAHDIQMNLLPKEPQKIEGYDIAGTSIPAKEVGGDYYDFIRIDERRLAFCLGDVTGKGLPAALLMANLQATVRGQTLLNMNVKDFIECANILLYQCTDIQKFVTLFYGILDTKTHKLSYCNAGHDNPFLFKRGKEPLRLESGGIVLGFMEKWSYAENQTTLNPGDILLVYSDGITEAFNKQGEEFGETNLAGLVTHHRDLPATDLMEKIIHAVQDHTQDEPQTDDVTLVIIKRNK